MDIRIVSKGTRGGHFRVSNVEEMVRDLSRKREILELERQYTINFMCGILSNMMDSLDDYNLLRVYSAFTNRSIENLKSSYETDDLEKKAELKSNWLNEIKVFMSLYKGYYFGKKIPKSKASKELALSFLLFLTSLFNDYYNYKDKDGRLKILINYMKNDWLEIQNKEEEYIIKYTQACIRNFLAIFTVQSEDGLFFDIEKNFNFLFKLLNNPMGTEDLKIIQNDERKKFWETMMALYFFTYINTGYGFGENFEGEGSLYA